MSNSKNTVICDCCDEALPAENAWLSWFMRRNEGDPDKAKRFQFVCYTITHRLYECPAKHRFGRDEKQFVIRSYENRTERASGLMPMDVQLLDMYAPVIVKRGLVGWADDYNVPGPEVAEVATRLAPLIVEYSNVDITEEDLAAVRKERQ